MVGNGAPPRNVYREAIDATCRLVQQRARAYRDLVVAVSLLGLGGLGWALWWQSVLPLALLLLFAPSTLLFLWHDRQLLNGWRARFLADWIKGALDFAALRGALLAHPALPQTTVAAMLDSLPGGGSPQHEREAVALTIMNSDRKHAVRLALAGLAGLLAAAGCLLAALLFTVGL